MKDFYVSDAASHENKIITSTFVVAAKQLRPRRGGEPYLSLTLSDRAGQMEGRVWDNVSDFVGLFDLDDFVKVKGLLNRYNKHFQITIHKLRRLNDAEVDYTDYFPRTSKDVDELWRALAGFVESVKDPHLRAVLQAFMADPEIAAAYRTAPAAKTLHHAYLGGLLDHVVSLCRLCELAASNYPQIDLDLLLAGAFLHDIGKVHELAYKRSFSYTTRGQLLGHMIIELEMLHAKIALVPGFPDRLKTLLEHLIISHHGQYEFGSPKLPMFPEALMLHYLDDLDSKMESMRAHLAREADVADDWTSYNPSLGRPLLKVSRFLENAPHAEGAAEPGAKSEGVPPPDKDE